MFPSPSPPFGQTCLSSIPSSYGMLLDGFMCWLQNRADYSGRAIGGVHDDAYGDKFEIGDNGAKKTTGIANGTET